MKQFVRKAAALAICAGIGIGMAGCKKSEPEPAVKPAVPVTATPQVATAPEPAAPSQTPPATPPAVEVKQAATATTGATRGPATAQRARSFVLRAVRTGTQPGADRIVFEFDGKGVPAWQVEYVDRPVHDCGSGDAVPVAGDAWLQVRFTGAQAHTDAGAATGGPRRRPLAQTIARELVRTCDFEGEVTWVIGVARPNAYTPRVFSAPSRLVIDIAH